MSDKSYVGGDLNVLNFERDVIMEIWGYAGILVPKEKPRKGRGGGGDHNSVAN